MSWDIYLESEHYEVKVPNHRDGGTFQVGGTTDPWLNVTYNYGKHFQFGELDGKTAVDTIGLLTDAVSRFGLERDDDYWKPTEGNVGYACSILLLWAVAHPTAKWRVE